jgi:hypothetical protein
MVNVFAYVRDPSPPSLGPLPTAPRSIINIPAGSTRWLAPRERLQEMPPNAVPFEFNGLQYYMLPLGNEHRL